MENEINVKILEVAGETGEQIRKLIEACKGSSDPEQHSLKCACAVCATLADGNLPRPPEGEEQVMLATVEALEQISDTCERSLEAGMDTTLGLLRKPFPPAVEQALLEHRTDRYNASVYCARQLNEMLPADARLPERLLHKPMSIQQALATLSEARAKMERIAAKHKAAREAEQQAEQQAADEPA